MTLKVGIVGCGNISRYHLAGWEKIGAQVKWLCDLYPEAAAERGRGLQARLTANHEDIMKDKEVNVVTVTTFSRFHKQICLDAIAAGKAVICEKTLATSAEDAWEIVAAAKKRGTLFYTMYMKRYLPGMEQMKALMGQLGKITCSTFRAYQCWGNLWDVDKSNEFFAKPASGPSEIVKRYGGGILVCGGSHILDLIGYLLGRPRKLYGKCVGGAGADYDLVASALLETDNGLVHFDAQAHPLEHIGFLRDGWDEVIEVNGVEGRLTFYSSKWDEFQEKAGMLVHYDNRSKQAHEYRYPACSPFERAIAAIGSDIEKGRQTVQSLYTGYDVDELISHIMRSSETGQTLDVHYRD